uniref:Uncharacterized protein n=1 Tax=Arundo donax TaxID=35708 RepID=A0A0A9HKI4_ARUDO
MENNWDALFEKDQVTCLSHQEHTSALVVGWL